MRQVKAISEKDKPWKQEAPPEVKKAVLALVCWLVLCVFIAFFEPAVGVVLFPIGFLIWTLVV